MVLTMGAEGELPALSAEDALVIDQGDQSPIMMGSLGIPSGFICCT